MSCLFKACSTARKTYKLLYLFHMKCLSLKPEDHIYLQVNAATWYCVKYTSELFPFNHFVDDDDTFVLEANQIDVGTKTIESLSELIFNSFELNDDANY